MSDIAEVRIDKWLWAVRLFKTRSLASEACKKGYVIVGGVSVKSSRNIKVGDVIQLKRAPVMFSYQVLGITEKRIGAKLVPDFMKDVTPEDQLEINNLQRLNIRLQRQRGTGRPTKKERRDLEDFFSE